MIMFSSAGRIRLCLVTHARFPIGEPRAERAARAAARNGYRVDVVALRGEGERATSVSRGSPCGAYRYVIDGARRSP